MANVIGADQLAAEIAATLQDYYGAVVEDVEAVTKTVGKATREKVRANARAVGVVRTGKYLKSWRVKITAKDGKANATIYAEAPEYRLTHLLENGHASVNGGRVPAYPHIGKAERWAIEEFEQRLKEAIEND